jgi:predicted membrane protein
MVIPFVRIWIPAVILGGAVGFLNGLVSDFWFGNSHLESGFLLAFLLAIRYAMVGMSLSVLFVFFGLIKYKDYFSREFEKRRITREQSSRKNKI